MKLINRIAISFYFRGFPVETDLLLIIINKKWSLITNRAISTICTICTISRQIIQTTPFSDACNCVVVSKLKSNRV